MASLFINQSLSLSLAPFQPQTPVAQVFGQGRPRHLCGFELTRQDLELLTWTRKTTAADGRPVGAAPWPVDGTREVRATQVEK